ncbi:MAG: cytochrome b [Gammaproteobacteria bacterium]|nr:cytochrome b [Gammaproteobacteria bacterium]CAJ2376904.1 MAG: Cytochrome b561 [Arenicellales bacterium IbO2]MDA7962707.1 cytochrome b [Gammaproteobacteria bacterium]MDA7969825.1 cytochrome b [Gammaproteobacteria bacterium]MDA7971486.1 cytochrome b [Gammaproteobacteria bacterium]
MKDTKEKFSTQTIALHWIIGVGMIAMIALGTYMAAVPYVSVLYSTHKSIGVLLLIVILGRIWWRMVNGWPQPVREFPRAQLIIARISHWTLIVGTALMPISGIGSSGFGGYGVAVFGVQLIPSNFGADGKAIAFNEGLAHFSHSLHYYAGNVLIAVIVLHLAAALKHHFFDKDNVLRRMLSLRG